MLSFDRNAWLNRQAGLDRDRRRNSRRMLQLSNSLGLLRRDREAGYKSFIGGLPSRASKPELFPGCY
jgi:hypothetical protein